MQTDLDCDAALLGMSSSCIAQWACTKAMHWLQAPQAYSPAALSHHKSRMLWNTTFIAHEGCGSWYDGWKSQ